MILLVLLGLVLTTAFGVNAIVVVRAQARQLSSITNRKVLPLNNCRQIQGIFREIESRMMGVISDLMATVGSTEHLRLAEPKISNLWSKTKAALGGEEEKSLGRDFEEAFAEFEKLSVELKSAYEAENTEKVEDAFDIWLDIKPKLRKSLDKLVEKLQEDVIAASETAQSRTSRTATITTSMIAVVLLFFSVITYFMAKNLRASARQIITASEELNISSQQHSTSLEEQTASISEISTTMEELQQSAKQISAATGNSASGADSANQAAHEGKGALALTNDGMADIQTQVRKITENMLALGEKTRQMGLILEIINELTDQTTILSYNATIEASGVGEKGNRFATVADQIMGLAEKAKDSTKEIRLLIEDIQKSSNTTVLISEEGMLKTAERY
jgi:methyl-accepting chemotaxis protein